ncbi:MAG: aquaporin Z [Roseococcus sp.]|nr:aquaporin Z [Roseococcus sp.]
MLRKLGVEFFGTFWIVLGGCGSAVLAAQFPETGIGFVGVSLAFGLTVLTMAYAMGHVSGGHFNPAVTIGVVAAGRMDPDDAIPYMVSQVAGAILAAMILWFIVSGQPGGWDLAVKGLAQNGYEQASPGRYSMASAFLTEMVFTFLLLMVVLGATSRKASAGFAPLAIGLCVTLIHLVTIPVTNTSVNPARSTGPAVFVGGLALQQLWLFWIAPLLGAALAGLANRFTEDNT